jgi:putative ABC transport system permease protein
MLRALTVTPTLLGRRADGAEQGTASTRASGADAVFDPDALFLSGAAMTQTNLRVGQRTNVQVGGVALSLRVVGDMPGVPAGQPIAMLDIAEAQWRFGKLGRLDRSISSSAEALTGMQSARPWRPCCPAVPGSAILKGKAGAGTACRVLTASIWTCWPLLPC